MPVGTSSVPCTEPSPCSVTSSLGSEYVAADHARAVEHLRRAHRVRQRAECVLHFLDAGHRAELGELAEELARVHRLERVLVLELGEHELQEFVLAELVLLLGPARLRSTCCAGAVDDVCNGHEIPWCLSVGSYWPSRRVASIISFAVFITSTLFWYEREAEIMSTISSTVLTFGAYT